MMDSKRFKCEYPKCEAAYAKMSRLVFHSRSHSGERPFICDFDDCRKSYAYNSHLKRHIETSHKKKDKPKVQYQCEQCKRFMGSLSALKKHTKIIHGPASSRPFICDICSSGFRRRNEYHFHMSKHSGNFPFCCKECPQSFLIESRLIRHQLSHAKARKELNWKCDCGEAFANITNLQIHQKKSHDIKYKCEICDKLVYNLHQHKKIHSESLQHTCPEEDCNKSYKHKRNLNFHILQAHKKLRFICTYDGCTALLSTKQKLLQHIDIIHKRNNDKVPNKPRKTIRAKRKDTGTVTFASAAILSGLRDIIPRKMQKEIIKNEVCVENVEKIVKNIEVNVADAPENAN